MGFKILAWHERFWELDPHHLSSGRRGLLSALKIVLQSSQGFMRDLCPLRASALTLYTLLSIVPVIAVAFGIAKGFGFQRLLEQLLLQLPAQDSLLKQIIDFAQKLLAKTQGEVVAGIGIAALLWVVISLIGEVEHTFNAIWKIPRDRKLGRKLTDYLSLSLFAPILLIVASSGLVLAEAHIVAFLHDWGLPLWLSSALQSSLQLLPLSLLAGLFAFVFIFLPNQNIGYRGGLIAGLITGGLYHAWQWLYVNLQIGVTSYNAIYGSFAAVPLFVVWLHVGWMLVLFGCQMAYFIQNDSHFSERYPLSALSFQTKKLLALRICQLVVKRFNMGLPPLNAHHIAIHLHLSTGIVQSLLRQLTACRLLVTVDGEDHHQPLFQPAVDVQQFSIAFVIERLENHGHRLMTNNEFAHCLELAQQDLAASHGKRLLLDCN